MIAQDFWFAWFSLFCNSRQAVPEYYVKAISFAQTSIFCTLTQINSPVSLLLYLSLLSQIVNMALANQGEGCSRGEEEGKETALDKLWKQTSILLHEIWYVSRSCLLRLLISQAETFSLFCVPWLSSHNTFVIFLVSLCSHVECEEYFSLSH